MLLDRYALFKVLDKPGVNYSNKLLNIHQQDFCESYFSLETIVYWLVTQSKVTYFPRFIYSPFAQQYTAFSYSAHFLSLVRHCKAHSLKKIRGKLFLDVILISQSRKNRPRLRSTRRRHATIYKISRTEITH